MTCDETVMPQDIETRQVFSVDAYGGVSNVSLEDMTANKHTITIYSIKDLELAILVIYDEHHELEL